MQKPLLLLLGLSWLTISVLAQQKKIEPTPAPQTYAVVVGISSYTHEVARLDFAHRDAEEFARFLKSDAGGNIPQDHIRLLLNEEATYSAVYNALFWLLETCQANDRVYFYFSGHGDVENSTIYKLGFLLAANTPRFNYINNAIRVEDLNNIANTLSSQRKARVILITDACRSGKLAGAENRGNFLVGEQLRDVLGNEIRITSCGPDELSNEDPGWAGGRGVFSYYLVKGLEGMADASGDRMVTLEEIKSYLKSALANDRILKEKEHPQHPVVNGRDSIVLSKVIGVPNRSVIVNSSQQDSRVMPAPVPEQLGLSPQGYVLGLAKGKKLETVLDFSVLEKLAPEKIPFACIDMITSSLKKADELDSVKLKRLIRSLNDNKDALQRFKEKLVESMADRGQEIINLYLEGDEAEIERRRYYNNLTNQYAVYPKMFSVAMKLVDPANQLYKILKVKYHYFSGVTLRMRLPFVSNKGPLIDSALREQLVALKLETNAAYIYNELGILYRLKSQNELAEKNYLRATLLAPSWALPFSNLSGLYAVTGETDKGMEMAAKAIQLQPDLQTASVNTGLLNERKGNLLGAEEYYLKSIRLNSRHYYPFERMGVICMKTTRYALADSNFIEAEKRKRGFVFASPDMEGDGVTDAMEVVSPLIPCNYDTTRIRPDDIIGQYYIGLKYLYAGNPDKAELKFKQVVRLDPSHPLAYFQLGKLMYEQQRWKEGEWMLTEAIRYHLDTPLFEKYCDSLLRLYPQYKENVNVDSLLTSAICAYGYFKGSWKLKMIPRFYLASVYEKRNYFTEAVDQFRAIIRENPVEKAAYVKCMTLLEKNGRYQDAENIIRSCPIKDIAENELAALFARITAANPAKGEFFYKAGVLMYDIVQENPALFSDDRKRLVPDSDTAVYLGKAKYRMQNKLAFNVPGTGELYELHESVLFPLTDGIRYLRQAARLIPGWNRVNLEDGSVHITDNLNLLAEIGFKTGDLYVWHGLPEWAEFHYRRSIDLKPDDAGVRTKYVYSSITNYNFTAALSQLDTLYNKGQINAHAQLLMARYCIHAGRFADARKLLRESGAIRPLPVPEISDLSGRLELLADQPLRSIPHYKTWLNTHPADHEAMYTLARIYAKTGNSAEAWKWLGKSLENGFNYYYVLQYDDCWNKYRAASRWKSLTSGVKDPLRD